MVSIKLSNILDEAVV